jgi:hypothetical protein
MCQPAWSSWPVARVNQFCYQYIGAGWIGAGRAVQNISMHLRQLEPTRFTTSTLETCLSSDHVY